MRRLTVEIATARPGVTVRLHRDVRECEAVAWMEYLKAVPAVVGVALDLEPGETGAEAARAVVRAALARQGEGA